MPPRPGRVLPRPGSRVLPRPGRVPPCRRSGVLAHAGTDTEPRGSAPPTAGAWCSAATPRTSRPDCGRTPTPSTNSSARTRPRRGRVAKREGRTRRTTSRNPARAAPTRATPTTGTGPGAAPAAAPTSGTGPRTSGCSSVRRSGRRSWAAPWPAAVRTPWNSSAPAPYAPPSSCCPPC